MKYGAERAHAVRILVILVFLGAMGATAALEPDGPVMFRPMWSEPDRAVRDVELHDLGAEFRLDVIPGVELRGASLEVRLPPGISGVPLAGADFETELEQDGTTIVRIGLGRLDGDAGRRLRFRLRLDGIEGAVATFTIVGTDERGTAIRDALGVVIGTPGVAPKSRHGAVEFRAVSIPDPNASTR